MKRQKTPKHLLTPTLVTTTPCSCAGNLILVMPIVNCTPPQVPLIRAGMQQKENRCRNSRSRLTIPFSTNAWQSQSGLWANSRSVGFLELKRFQLIFGINSSNRARTKSPPQAPTGLWDYLGGSTQTLPGLLSHLREILTTNMSSSTDPAHPIRAFHQLTELHLNITISLKPLMSKYSMWTWSAKSRSGLASVWSHDQASTPQHDYSIFYFPDSNVWSWCTKEPVFHTSGFL